MPPSAASPGRQLPHRSRHSATGLLTVTPTTSYGAPVSAAPATRPACVPHDTGREPQTRRPLTQRRQLRGQLHARADVPEARPAASRRRAGPGRAAGLPHAARPWTASMPASTEDGQGHR